MEHLATWPYIRAYSRGRAFFTTVLILTLSLSSASLGSHALAKDVTFTDFPFLVHCELGGVHRAFYLSKIEADGVAIYISPDNLAGTMTINGTAGQAMGGKGPGNCSGKTLEELRSAGQAFYLQR